MEIKVSNKHYINAGLVYFALREKLTKMTNNLLEDYKKNAASVMQEKLLDISRIVALLKFIEEDSFQNTLCLSFEGAPNEPEGDKDE